MLKVLEINENKDNIEVVSWYSLSNKDFERIKRQATREDGQILILSPDNGSVAALSALPNGVSSTDKDTKIIQSSNKIQKQMLPI